MKDFQSVKQRDGAWNFHEHDDHATALVPIVTGNSRYLTMLMAAQFRCAAALRTLLLFAHLFAGKKPAAM